MDLSQLKSSSCKKKIFKRADLVKKVMSLARSVVQEFPKVVEVFKYHQLDWVE